MKQRGKAKGPHPNPAHRRGKPDASEMPVPAQRARWCLCREHVHPAWGRAQGPQALLGWGSRGSDDFLGETLYPQAAPTLRRLCLSVGTFPRTLPPLVVLLPRQRGQVPASGGGRSGAGHSAGEPSY